MGTEVKPVRAWAEYDEWSVHFDSWLDEPYDDVLWQRVWIPKGAQSSWDEVGGTPTSLVQQIEAGCPGYGPLRSIRILLSGHDGNLRLYRYRERVLNPTQNAYESAFIPPGSWSWYLFDRCGGRATAGWFAPDTTDAEAVTRALAEAVAWIQGQQGVTA